MTTLFLLLSIYFSEPPALTDKASAPTTTVPATAAQTENAKGNWLIQTIPGISNRVLVLYFNEKNELIKKEWRSLDEADISKGKVVRSLKRSLHEALKFQSEEEVN